jgi:hypothetical protein
MRTTSAARGHGVGIVTDDVADQHHLGQPLPFLLLVA